MKNEMVTIALHTGKKEYYPLIENFLKSLLMCVTYPKLEIMLIESSGNNEIRSWFDKIDFDDYFINFSGVKTNIKKHTGVDIIKTVKCYDFAPELEWFECYLQSIQLAIDDSIGKYFCFFAEDNQFTVRGDIINDYIKIIKKENNCKSFVHFFAQQKYKLFKSNNYFDKKSSNVEGVEYYKPKHKWDFWSLTLTKNYLDIGRLVKPTSETYADQHRPVDDYSKRTKEAGYVRVYPKLSHGVWFHNNDRDKIISSIMKNSNNPDYVYYKIFDKATIMQKIESYKLPLSTDDYKDQTN
jgi:hypothetical protein